MESDRLTGRWFRGGGRFSSYCVACGLTSFLSAHFLNEGIAVVEIEEPVQHPVLRIKEVVARFEVGASKRAGLGTTKTGASTWRQGPVGGSQKVRWNAMSSGQGRVHVCS